MGSRRVPGRPLSAERFGREKIIGGFRALVREGRGTISRKDLAAKLGITPALITYYFPEAHTLLQEACSGIFDQWLSRIASVDIEEKDAAASLVRIIVDFFRAEFSSEDLIRSLLREGILKDTTLLEMEKKTEEKIAQLLSREQAESAFIITQIVWGSARQCAVSGIEEAPTALLMRLLHHLI